MTCTRTTETAPETAATDNGETRGRHGRRGLIAGAAVLAAGLLAKEALAPERVAATDGSPLVVGVNNTTAAQTLLTGNFTNGNQPMFFVDNTSGTGTGIEGLVGGSGFGLFGQSASGAGVFGTSTSGPGVSGVGGSGGGNGVLGTASGNDGVSGTTTATAVFAGVRGLAPKTGVFGTASNTGLIASDLSYGVFGTNGGGANRYGVYGLSGSGGQGVGGMATGADSIGVSGTSDVAFGVSGTSTSGVGVSGQTSSTSIFPIGGVQGNGARYGVVGSANAATGTLANGAFGVVGLTGGGAKGYGVVGGYFGVVGTLANGVLGSGVTGGVGVSGTSDSGTGVQGTSTTGVGVYGISGGGSSAGAQPYGVVGSVTGAPGFGLFGVTSVAGTVGFAGGAAVSGGIAGQFSGPVNIYNSVPGAGGNLYVQGNQTVSGAKSAAVPHPDGTHRLLYCVESPEAWFEDFGEGTITAGRAEVKLDPDFAAVVDTSRLHVFCMPHDETHHLAVKARSGNGFSVAADVTGAAAARGAKAADLSGTFTYRVVAKRKDVVAERLAKFAVPQEIKPPALVIPPAPPSPPLFPMPPMGGKKG